MIGILGGGLSAVSLQRFLSCDSEILEKESRLGGLCRTFTKDGFSYDIGGHILFSKDSAVMDVIKSFLGDNINYCRRNNKILYQDKLVKYPFENGLGALDKEEIYDCLISYLKNPYPEPKNFKEWNYHTFGEGIANKYLVPYNKKIWKEPLENMGLEWVERVPKPPLEDIIKSALCIETEGYVHQLNFLYPLFGGIESLVKSALRKEAKAVTGFQIERIEKKKGQWIVSNGETDYCYDEIVVTFPIKEAVRCFADVPSKVLTSALNLRHNSVKVVLVGLKNGSLLDKSAVYVPQSNVIFHRLCYLGYFSPNNVPEGSSSLIAEITAVPDSELAKTSDSVITETVVNDLARLGIIEKSEVAVTDITNIDYGYVVYDLAWKKSIQVIQDYFGGLGVELLGRFAQFEYINMDEVLRRSMSLAEKINRRC